MSKSTLFALAGFLLVSVALGVDITGIGRSPLPKGKRVMISPTQACKLRRLDIACADFMPNTLCSNLRCLNASGKVVLTNQAPDDMWCAVGKICRSGACVNSDLTKSPALSEITRMTVC